MRLWRARCPARPPTGLAMTAEPRLTQVRRSQQPVPLAVPQLSTDRAELTPALVMTRHEHRDHLRGAALDLSQPSIMGVLNVTPDSFSDGGQLYQGAALIPQSIAETC